MTDDSRIPTVIAEHAGFISPSGATAWAPVGKDRFVPVHKTGTHPLHSWTIGSATCPARVTLGELEEYLATAHKH